jgi:hypothetical protein
LKFLPFTTNGSGDIVNLLLGFNKDDAFAFSLRADFSQQVGQPETKVVIFFHKISQFRLTLLACRVLGTPQQSGGCCGWQQEKESQHSSECSSSKSPQPRLELPWAM